LSFQAGAIVSQLTLDKSKFSTAIKGVKKETTAMGGWVKNNSAQFKRMGLAITAMGTAALFTYKKMVDKYIEVGDQIDKMRKRTGFSAEALSELSYAAEISGADLGLLEKGVKRMAKTITDAGEGMATYIRAFDRMGIKIEDIQGLKPEEQFRIITEAMAELGDETVQAATAQDIFGRAGTMLLPLMKEGKEGIQKLREEAHELGIVFDEEAAAKAAKLKDAQTALKKAMQGLGFAIVEDTIPVLTQMATHFKDVFVNIQDNTQSFTNSILGFFKILVLGISGLLIAWTGLKTGVFKVSAYVAGQLEKFLYAIVAQMALLEKIPIIGKKIVPITDAMYETLKSVTAITQGYNEEGEKQIDILTNQAIFLEQLIKALNDAKTGFQDLATESAGASKTIVETVLPAIAQAADALKKLAEKQGEATSEIAEQSKELTKGEQIAMEAMMAAYQGGLEGMISYFENLAVAALLKWIMSTVPFPANLIMAPVAMIAAKKLFEGLKSFEEGGEIGREGGIVGEEGPEYFAPARPGTIIPLTGPTAGLRPVEVVIAPSFHIEAVDEYSVKRFIEERGAPALIEMLKNKHLLDEFQKALGV